MKLFKRLLGINKESESEVFSTPEALPYEENWTTYLTPLNGNSVGSIIVDLGLQSIAPNSERPLLTTVYIEIAVKTENGLPLTEERDTLDMIEEAICEDLQNRFDAIFPGHLYTDNRLEAFFYCKDSEEIDNVISLRMADWPDYRFTVKHDLERDWKTYFELLFPSPIQMQSIGNRQVIANLLSHGDALQSPRPVDHWIYFRSSDTRQRFVSVITGKGFNVVEQPVNEEVEEPFGLHISRIDKVDPESTDEYILELWQIADDCGGRYDGWETFIVRDDVSEAVN